MPNKTFNLTPTFIDELKLKGATKILLLWLYSKAFFDKKSQSHCAVPYSPTKWAPMLGYSAKTIITAIHKLQLLGAVSVVDGVVQFSKPGSGRKNLTNSSDIFDFEDKSQKNPIPEPEIEQKDTEVEEKEPEIEHKNEAKEGEQTPEPKQTTQVKDVLSKERLPLLNQLENCIEKGVFSKKKLAEIKTIRRDEFEYFLRNFHKSSKFDHVFVMNQKFQAGEKFEYLVKFIKFHWDDEQFPRYVLFLFLQYFTDKSCTNPHGFFITSMRKYREKPLMERLKLLEEVNVIRRKANSRGEIEEKLAETEYMLRKTENNTKADQEAQDFINTYLKIFPESLAEAEAKADEQLGDFGKGPINPDMLKKDRLSLRDKMREIAVRAKLKEILTRKVSQLKDQNKS